MMLGMRSPHRRPWAAPCALLAAMAGCHAQPLLRLDGWLIFSAPDSPASLQQIDAGLVTIDFGQVPVGTTETIAVSYTSLAGFTGLGAPAQDAGDFSLSLSSATVATPQLEASFTPGEVGSQSAVLQMTEGSLLVPNVTFELAGTGVGAALLVEPNPISFDLVPDGKTVSRTFSITNKATTPVSLVFSALQGDDPQLFSISGTGQGPLAPGASQTFTASFSAMYGGQTTFCDVTGLSTQAPV